MPGVVTCSFVIAHGTEAGMALAVAIPIGPTVPTRGGNDGAVIGDQILFSRAKYY
jgi:hypothetical protein